MLHCVVDCRMSAADLHQKFVEVLVAFSVASVFSDAVKEWVVIRRYTEDYVKCVCGKEECVYVSTIQNNLNGNVLDPVGSSCVRWLYGEENWRAHKYYAKWAKDGHESVLEEGSFAGRSYMEASVNVDYVDMVRSHGYRTTSVNERKFQMWLRDGKYYKYI